MRCRLVDGVLPDEPAAPIEDEALERGVQPEEGRHARVVSDVRRREVEVSQGGERRALLGRREVDEGGEEGAARDAEGKVRELGGEGRQGEVRDAAELEEDDGLRKVHLVVLEDAAELAADRSVDDRLGLWSSVWRRRLVERLIEVGEPERGRRLAHDAVRRREVLDEREAAQEGEVVRVAAGERQRSRVVVGALQVHTVSSCLAGSSSERERTLRNVW